MTKRQMAVVALGMVLTTACAVAPVEPEKVSAESEALGGGTIQLGKPCTTAGSCVTGAYCSGPAAWVTGVGTAAKFVVPSGAPSPTCETLCNVYENTTSIVGLADNTTTENGGEGLFKGVCTDLDPGAGLNYAACNLSNVSVTDVLMGTGTGECELNAASRTPGGDCNGYAIPSGDTCVGAPVCPLGSTTCTGGTWPDSGSWGDYAGYGGYGNAVIWNDTFYGGWGG